MDKKKVSIKLVEGKFKIYNKSTHEFIDKNFNSIDEANKFIDSDLKLKENTQKFVKYYGLKS